MVNNRTCKPGACPNVEYFLINFQAHYLARITTGAQREGRCGKIVFACCLRMMGGDTISKIHSLVKNDVSLQQLVAGKRVTITWKHISCRPPVTGPVNLKRAPQCWFVSCQLEVIFYFRLSRSEVSNIGGRVLLYAWTCYVALFRMNEIFVSHFESEGP